MADDAAATRAGDRRPVRLEVGQATSVGRVRTANEDSVLCEPIEAPTVRERGLFCAVADGMGGHAAGDVASALAVRTARDAFYGADAESIEAAVRGAVERANAEVFAAGSGKGGRAQMGSTLTAAAILDGRAIIGHVGDTRCYLLAGGQIRQLTRDHSWVAEEVEAGALTAEEARMHPRRNIITRALGLQPALEVDVYQEEVPPGAMLLLCSDGLHGLVRDEEILDRAMRLPPQAAVDSLVGLANERGGHDNISAILIRVGPADQTQTAPSASTADTNRLPVLGGQSPGLTREATAVRRGRGTDPRPPPEGGQARAGGVGPRRDERRTRLDWRLLTGAALAVLVLASAVGWMSLGFWSGPNAGGLDPTPASAPAVVAPPATPVGTGPAPGSTPTLARPTPTPAGSSPATVAGVAGGGEVTPAATATAGSLGQRRQLQVIQDNAAIRLAPVSDAPIAVRVPGDERLGIEAEVNGESIDGSARWYLVSYDSGGRLTRGFIHSSVVRELP